MKIVLNEQYYLLSNINKRMKKAVELKTMMFAIDRNQKEQQIHSPSPKKGLSRIQTSPQNKFKGNKLQKKKSEQQPRRRFSQQTQTKKYNHQEGNIIESKMKRSRCVSQNPTRYDTFVESPEDSMVYSRSNIKITPLNRREETIIKDDQKAVTSMNWDQMLQCRKGRMKSEPTNRNNLKNEIMLRISKKLDFMKKMTAEGQIIPSHFQKNRLGTQYQGNKLFNFDRLYEHCLKKINKNLNIYEKDIGKSKDRKYYQLKIESSILSTELKSMRKSLEKPKEQRIGELGVIGNVIELGKGERVVSQRGERPCSKCSRGNIGLKKKLGLITRKIEGHNPFKGQLHPWQIRFQKADDFQLK